MAVRRASLPARSRVLCCLTALLVVIALTGAPAPGAMAQVSPPAGSGVDPGAPGPAPGGASETVSEQDEIFAVDSFIPERFTDLEWRVVGGFELSGSHANSEALSSYENTVRWMEYGNSDSGERISLNSFVRRRHETIPRFLDLALNLRAGFDHYSWTNERSSLDLPSHEREERADGNGRRFSFDLDPEFDAGQYVVRDLFVSIAGRADLYYWDEPPSSMTRRTTAVRHVSGAIVERQQRVEREQRANLRRMYGVELVVLPGWGRVYEGLHASTALYIIDELERHNLLAARPTATQLHALSEIIYQYRLEHAIDARLHKIATLEAITGHLRAAGLVTAPDPISTILVEDVWTAFPHQSRRFGYRVRVGFGLDQSRSSSERGTFTTLTQLTTLHDAAGAITDTLSSREEQSFSYTDSEITSHRPHALVQLEYYRPLNHRLQLDLGSELRYFVNATSEYTSGRGAPSFRRSEQEIEYDDFHTLDASGKLLYILDSRTMLSLSGTFTRSSAARRVRELVMDESGSVETIAELPEEVVHQLWLAAGVDFRISIPTTLSVLATYSNSSTEESATEVLEDRDRSSYRVNMSLQHWFK